MQHRSVFVLGAAAGLFVTAPSPGARACGGFFCNQPQNANDQPIAQTAENVLFAMARGANGQYRLEAHVQIFYTGPADRFSWVVPVDNKPELDVGSNQLFTSLLGATQPSFGVDFREEGKCRVIPWPSTRSVPTSGGSAGAGSGGAGGSGGSAASGPMAPGVQVAFRGDVGPYDAAVIRSTDPNDSGPLLKWLETNKYFVSDQAARLIAGYVREDKYFVAIRLQNDRSVSEIEPLIMKFEGPGPCIPLKLTAIAAVRDLAINLWVLAQSRVVPDNFYEIKINDARINWLNGGQGYADVVKRAADEAGGQGFVTEYAGPSSLVRDRLPSTQGLTVDGVRSARTPPEALDQIGRLFFIPRGTKLLEILRRYIPEPEVLKQMGVSETQFYNAIGVFWEQYRQQFKPLDANALANELDAKFLRPLTLLRELFTAHPKLTRLSTFISPEEMTVDPTFVENPSLPDVPLARRAQATLVCGEERFTRCDAPLRMRLPSGRTLWMRPEPVSSPCYGETRAYQYRRPDLSAMPALDVAWRRDRAGEGMRRIDWGNTIEAILDAINRPVQVYAATEQSSGVYPLAADAGVPPSDGTGDDDGVNGGCSCDLTRAPRAALIPGAALAALGLVFTRRAARGYRRRRSAARAADPRT